MRNIAANGPKFFACNVISIVKEITDVNIVLAASLFAFAGLLALAEVHVAGKMHGAIGL